MSRVDAVLKAITAGHAEVKANFDFTKEEAHTVGNVLVEQKSFPRSLETPKWSLDFSEFEDTEVSLSHKGMGDSGAIVVSYVLKVNTTIQDFTISANQVGDVGATALAKALEINKTITQFNIDWNEVGDVGATALAKALEKNQDIRLEVLDLRYNRITHLPPAFAFAQVETLELVGNPIVDPPQSIAFDTHKLKHYLGDLRQSEPVRRVKVLVLGPKAAGKSRFIQRCLRLDAKLLIKDVNKWDADDVIYWMDQIGLSRKLQEQVKQEEKAVTGERLLRQDSVLKQSPFKDRSVKKRIKEEVKLLNSAQEDNLEDGDDDALRLSTVGVKLYSAPQSPDHDDVILEVLDFGGQAEYYLTNMLFMGDVNALYLMMSRTMTRQEDNKKWNANVDQEKETRFWLNFFTSLLDTKSTARTVLLNSFTDKFEEHVRDRDVRDAGMIYKRLKDHFPQIMWGGGDETKVAFDVNYEEEDSMVELRQVIFSVAEQISAGRRIPRSYVIIQTYLSQQFYTKIEKGQAPLLQWSEVTQAIRSNDLPEMKEGLEYEYESGLEHRALEYLSAVGEVYINQEADLLVLHPLEWFSVVLNTIINHTNIGEDLQPDHGRYTYSQMEKVCELLDIERGEARDMLSTLEKLSLCITLDQKETYLFPCLLPAKSVQEQESQKKHHDEFLLDRHTKSVGRAWTTSHPGGSFIPPGLFHRLQVELVKLVKERKPYCDNKSEVYLFKDEVVIYLYDPAGQLHANWDTQTQAVRVEVISASPLPLLQDVNTIMDQLVRPRGVYPGVRQYLQRHAMCPRCCGVGSFGSCAVMTMYVMDSHAKSSTLWERSSPDDFPEVWELLNRDSHMKLERLETKENRSLGWKLDDQPPVCQVCHSLWLPGQWLEGLEVVSKEGQRHQETVSTIKEEGSKTRKHMSEEVKTVSIQLSQMEQSLLRATFQAKLMPDMPRLFVVLPRKPASKWESVKTQTGMKLPVRIYFVCEEVDEQCSPSVHEHVYDVEIPTRLFTQLVPWCQFVLKLLGLGLKGLSVGLLDISALINVSSNPDMMAELYDEVSTSLNRYVSDIGEVLEQQSQDPTRRMEVTKENQEQLRGLLGEKGAAFYGGLQPVWANEKGELRWVCKNHARGRELLPADMTEYRPMEQPSSCSSCCILF